MEIAYKIEEIRSIDHAETGRLARAERKRLGVGLRELARRIDFPPSYVSYLERGKRQWSEEIVASFNKGLEQ